MDCDACISVFVAAGGCSCLTTPSCNPLTLLPSESCFSCAHETLSFCGVEMLDESSWDLLDDSTDSSAEDDQERIQFELISWDTSDCTGEVVSETQEGGFLYECSPDVSNTWERVSMLCVRSRCGRDVF